MQNSIKTLQHWFEKNNWKPLPFQKRSWKAYLQGYSGIVNAPTGSGKTYALLLPAIIQAQGNPKQGIKIVCISPLKALSKEIKLSVETALKGLDLSWSVAIRTGDSSSTEKQKIYKHPPDVLITTPESLHVLLSRPEHPKLFQNLEACIVDEWHDLMGSKRGVQVQLALSWLFHLHPFQIWGISATIGNIESAGDVLIGQLIPKEKVKLIRSNRKTKIEVKTILPQHIDNFPWAGHLGLKLIDEVLKVIKNHQTIILFTNTRSQTELWYQNLLEKAPELAGVMAMHHGSLSPEIRNWVENALHEGKLKIVISTSSLDLGVDFRPVDAVIQVGSPKGVARFLQRAGRSGHRPEENSIIYFLPTHALEILESSALQEAIQKQKIEDRTPYLHSHDVLIQFMMTLACSTGFNSALLDIIRLTFCYQAFSADDWHKLIEFLCFGGKGLQRYEEYQKIGLAKDGKYYAINKRIVRRHKMSIGTIVGDGEMSIQYKSGRKIGTVEEWFLAQLNPGDTFWFAGRALELLYTKEMKAIVKKSKNKTAKIPAWMGGRIPLSSTLAAQIREELQHIQSGKLYNAELQILAPLMKKQATHSHIPNQDELLIEYFEDREGEHLMIYPFAGRFVHEGIASLIAYRLGMMTPLSFSISMNDYGFEMVSQTHIPIEKIDWELLFSTENLSQDIQKSINHIEMAKRKFRDIASIGGLLFKGFPGLQKKEKHLQSSASLLFNVLSEYDPDNPLYIQAFEEIKQFQLEEARIHKTLETLNRKSIVYKSLTNISPFGFPLMVDRLRERLSTEQLENRIERLIQSLQKDNNN